MSISTVGHGPVPDGRNTCVGQTPSSVRDLNRLVQHRRVVRCPRGACAMYTILRAGGASTRRRRGRAWRCRRPWRRRSACSARSRRPSSIRRTTSSCGRLRPSMARGSGSETSRCGSASRRAPTSRGPTRRRGSRNNRRWAQRIAALPGARTIASLDDIPDAGAWIAKVPWTAAGRNRVRWTGAPAANGHLYVLVQFIAK